MKAILALALTVSTGCALPAGVDTGVIPISAVSHNKSDVDVYLLCGDRDAEWLGVVRGKELGLFEIPVTRTLCARGLNFFLVPRDGKRGYWVGPFRPRRGLSVGLTIERYAALSSALVQY